MLIDDVTITITAGNGGNGAVSFKRNAQTPKGGPDGGNGGNGGDVYFIGVDEIDALSKFQYKKHFRADDGVKGGKYNLYGKNATDLIIPIPLGTTITDTKTGEVFEITTKEQQLLIAKGGNGGRGNNSFKTATLQTPKFAEDGEAGEEKQLHLELKLIADIGFIGLPNAGKSSLLAVLTNARPKIGNYAFTTLEPNLGMLENLTLADIPGLIEGAASGKGLGITFLKHIEKTKLLVHCIDSAVENVVKTYEIVRSEFEKYNKLLLEKPELIVLTKIDTITHAELQDKWKQLERFGKKIISVSLYDDKSVEELKTALKSN